MTQEENRLLNKSAIVSREITRLAGEYNKAIGHIAPVMAQLTKAENRSREYENGSFIVLVVGPVKSGKSTLVNLIANAYVSPTHFLECTVRPSIISQRRAGEECRITVFTSEEPTNRVEQIDAIIDTLRGIEKEASLHSIKKSQFDLTPENIKEKVELGLKESLSSETLLTSITTPGGKLMKQDVFIIDMPGFDGEYANIDNPVYDTIAQRADLIIFVQSSHSAISKVSGQFLKKLADNNKDVPVCLIHNVFDSSWWRPEAERAATAQDQKEFAINEIRKQGFNIDERQCFSINLGMVHDGRKPAYAATPALARETAEYERIEGVLYDRVINRRDAMRLHVCLSRTRQQIEKTLAAIDQETARRSLLAERYKHAESEFAKTAGAPDLLSCLPPVTVDYAVLNAIVRDEARRRIALVDTSNNHTGNAAARGIVEDFIAECENSIAASLGRVLSLDQKEEALYLACKSRIGDIKEAVVACGAQPAKIDIERIALDTIPSVSLSEGIDLRLLIPYKTMIPMIVARFGGHSAEDVVSYINKTAESLAGSAAGDSGHTEGYIAKEGGAVKPLLDQVNLCLESAAADYGETCLRYWQQSRDTVLNDIIADKEAFDEETLELEKLKEALQKTILQI